MPTSREEVMEHLKQEIATFEAHARRAETMVPLVAEKYRDKWKAAIESTWRQAMELSALLQEIEKDHPHN